MTSTITVMLYLNYKKNLRLDILKQWKEVMQIL